MSDHLAAQDALSNQDESAGRFAETAGQMLKKARVNAGLHIAALAVSLRVPVKRIEALENGQMDLLPDMVFVRALTSSICQALKIDAQPILDKLPKAALPRLNSDEVAINTPIGASSSKSDSWVLGVFSSPLLLGALLLSISALGVYFWPKALVATTTQAVVVPKITAEVGVSQAKEVQVSNESVATPAVPVVVAAANTVSNSVADTNVAILTDQLITFKASGETWVEVKNASGSTVFKKLLAAGESVGSSGTLPLTVIVGRADVTQVEVRGKPFDLAAIAKSNVAKFEVN